MKVEEGEVKTFSAKEIVAVCDHTFLKRPEGYIHEVSLEGAVRKREAEFFRFLENVCESRLRPYAVCVRAEDVPHAASYFQQRKMNKIKIAAVVGFPDGSWYKTHYKLFEAQYALNEGAHEIDAVMNWEALKNGDHGAVLDEIRSLTQLVHKHRGAIKIILETSELNVQQIAQACKMAAMAGADFVKTSTGFGAFGAQYEKLEAICQNFSGGIKVSGGVTLDNIGGFLALIGKYRGFSKLTPDTIRVGERLLLDQLLSLA